jgi:hypothetical protein
MIHTVKHILYEYFAKNLAFVKEVVLYFSKHGITEV